MSEPVMSGEFERAIERLSREVLDGNAVTKDVLVEAKRTNGRVYALEQVTAVLAIRLATIEQNTPLTRRDLWVVTGTLGAAMAIVKWLPVLLTAGQVAP